MLKKLLKRLQQKRQSQREKDLLRILNSTQDFQKGGQLDLFLGQAPTYYELWQKYQNELQVIIDRLLFYHLSTDKLLKNEDVRLGFEYAYDVLLETLRKNVEEVQDEKKLKKMEEIEEKITPREKIKMY